MGKLNHELEALKAEFIERKLAAAIGADWTVVRTTKAFDFLDIERIRKEMGEAWCEAREKPGSRTTFTVSRTEKGAEISR